MVVASVEDTVKSELKTYSAAVQESNTSAACSLLDSNKNILKRMLLKTLWQKVTEVGI